MTPRELAQAIELAAAIIRMRGTVKELTLDYEVPILAEAVLTLVEQGSKLRSDLAALQLRYDQAIHELEMLATDKQVEDGQQQRREDIRRDLR